MIATEACRHRAALWHMQVAKLLRDAMPVVNASGSPEKAGLDGALEAEVPAFHVATRVGQLPNVRRALREAQEGVPADRLPLAVIKDEGHNQTFMSMPLDAFLLLVSGWWAATQPIAVASQPASPEQRSE